ncbi:isocitrate lyase/phosphoenolpyruvate mutase family protein [Streptomyces sp. NPDC005065]|uniref:isocitrate lyase/phosphoenolpyruvate mutase family protein n=1 Tax=Streptomyces sp. NPDC005065 TaxID=3154461 RepID=UPI0033AEC4B9
MALHTRDGGLVMPNAWDDLSALMLADAGFEAIATSSAALAATLGRSDGRHEVTRGEHLEHARLLGRLTGLPVNGDFEDGYGDTPEDVAATVEAAVEFGTIILTTRADVPDSHLEAVFTKERADGRFPDPSKQELEQTYMAVGLTMMAAAELGVEATPLEGFDPTSVDKAFKIRESGHTTTVLLALGYPDPERVYTTPISRFDADQLFTFI